MIPSGKDVDPAKNEFAQVTLGPYVNINGGYFIAHESEFIRVRKEQMWNGENQRVGDTWVVEFLYSDGHLEYDPLEADYIEAMPVSFISRDPTYRPTRCNKKSRKKIARRIVSTTEEQNPSNSKKYSSGDEGLYGTKNRLLRKGSH